MVLNYYKVAEATRFSKRIKLSIELDRRIALSYLTPFATNLVRMLVVCGPSGNHAAIRKCIQTERFNVYTPPLIISRDGLPSSSSRDEYRIYTDVMSQTVEDLIEDAQLLVPMEAEHWTIMDADGVAART